MEVDHMEALWWYGIHGNVDDQTARNGITATFNGENPHAHRDELLTLEPTQKIFLSHSGAQAGFVEQLDMELKRCDRYPFYHKDKHSLPIGEDFPRLIFKAIEQCQVGVLVLSEQYFTRSKWPMLEFTAMAKKRNESCFLLIPVFYTISRDECRNPVTHKRWLKVWQRWAQSDTRINLDEWKQALTLLGPTNGLIYVRDSSEFQFREQIIKAVCQRVPPATMMDDSYVRAKPHFCKVLHEKITCTSVCESYGVRVMGLYGTGGIGKTTILKVLCNEYYTRFQGRVCHLQFEPEEATKLKFLQEALKTLTDIRPEHLESQNIDKCRYLLNKNMHKLPVFLALDNVADTVESIEQVTMYLKAGYNESSVVIVAARSLGQLTGLGISEEDCMEMPELEEEEARALFLDQFQLIPEIIDDEDEEFLMKCVRRCRFRKAGDTTSDEYQYVPLALKMMGIQLRYLLGFNPKLWEEELKTKLDTFNYIGQKKHPIFGILRWSFDALQREDQLLFMDVALFVPRFGNDWSGLVPKWSILHWLSLVHRVTVDDVKFRLKGLKRKSLLESMEEDWKKIGMHDLWHEFAEMETTREDFKDRRWLYDIPKRPLVKLNQAQQLLACENLQRIMCRGASLLAGVKYGTVTVLHLHEAEYRTLDVAASLVHLRSLALNMSTDQGQIDVPKLALLRNLGFLKILCKQISTKEIFVKLRQFAVSYLSSAQRKSFYMFNFESF